MMTLLMTAALLLGDMTPAQPQAAAPAPVAAPQAAQPVSAQPVAQAPAAQAQVALVDDEFDDDFLESEDTLDEEIALLDGSGDLMEDDEDQ